MVNKQTVAPPIPHPHALLTSGDEPPPEIDVFDLIKSSYEVMPEFLSVGGVGGSLSFLTGINPDG